MSQFRAIALTLGAPAQEFQAAHGGELFRHKIMRVGTWVKGGDPVNVTAADLQEMVRNFDQHCLKGMLVVDYEHASMHPERAMGGPIPAAGWIHELATDGQWLSAAIEWTAVALQMIRAGQYRFCSPCWFENGRDLKTGIQLGNQFVSLALTNYPQMEDLPAIECTALDGEQMVMGADGNTGLDSAVKSPSAGTGGEQERTMSSKQLTLRPITSGDHAGNHGVMDGDNQMGHVTDHHLSGYAKQFCHSMSAADLAAKLGVVTMTAIGADGLEATAIKALVEKGRSAEAKEKDGAARVHLMAAFTAPDAKFPGAVTLNEASAMQLARDGKITTVDFIAASAAQKALDAAVKDGKILPRERAFYLRDALDRPTEFAAFLKDRPAVVTERSLGNPVGEPVPVMQEVRQETERVMKEMRAADSDFAKKKPQQQTVEARKRLFRENPGLAQRYREETESRRGGGGSASGAARGAVSGITA